MYLLIPNFGQCNIARNIFIQHCSLIHSYDSKKPANSCNYVRAWLGSLSPNWGIFNIFGYYFLSLLIILPLTEIQMMKFLWKWCWSVVVCGVMRRSEGRNGVYDLACLPSGGRELVNHGEGFHPPSSPMADKILHHPPAPSLTLLLISTKYHQHCSLLHNARCARYFSQSWDIVDDF